MFHLKSIDQISTMTISSPSKINQPNFNSDNFSKFLNHHTKVQTDICHLTYLKHSYYVLLCMVDKLVAQIYNCTVRFETIVN